ncbi:hypothetical protein J4217_04745 [Candidatus Pacearchaeota archaeon]|nr:hypothetical protein [Candidatus Pacearchaeota archaeon]
MEEKSEKEKRIRAITRLYYSNPKIIEALLRFSKDREVVPRYFEGFGKRPDALQYPSDIQELVNKGATSFHCSEELWNDPLGINNEMSQEQFNELRKGWDLLIDIDSPYLDLSKIAAKLVIKALEYHNIKNCGIKYSGSKGFHIILPWKAFPEEFQGKKTKDMFPEWPRAITEYLFSWINPIFMKEAGKIMTFEKKDDKIKIFCINCDRESQKGIITKFNCPVCGLKAERKEVKVKKRLRCMNGNCPGILEVIDEKEYYYCDYCKDPDNEKLQLNSERHPEDFREKRGEDISEHAKFDLVLVAPRHLFRMPYSLHEKTSFSSVVIKKEDIENFAPRDANPMNIKILDFYPECEEREAEKLLSQALSWKQDKQIIEEKVDKQYYKNYKTEGDDKDRVYEEIKAEDVREDYYPEPIKKLLLGLQDGRKRGLFVLLTFFKSLNFFPEKINDKIREWNKKNPIPLKEGYVKSQIDWHLKQKKKILPPNYDNDAFYKDLGLIDKRPEVKNPIVDVARKIRKNK